jgi:multidrug efflux pump
MNSVIAAAIGRSRTVLFSLMLIFIVGLYAYFAIPKESDPDINIPIIYVSMHHEGISPEDAERMLLRPMEQELRSIEGVKEMRSTAYEGGGNVTLEFDAGFNADQAMTDVRDKVDIAKADLPDEADEPTVNEVNLSLFPVLVVNLSGPVPERTLLHAARALEDAIESLPTVLSADIRGERDELLEVVIDPKLVESYGLRAEDILALIGRSNMLVAAGNLDTGAGRFGIKVPGLFENLNDILEMPVKVSEGAVVRFRDIAEIRRGFKDPESFARFDGQPSLSLEVVKRTGENVIATIAAVNAVIEQARPLLPPGVNIAVSQDKSSDIRNMLGDLQNNVLSAILLIMVVVVAGMGLRTGLLVGLAIPGSFLLGIMMLFFGGISMNVVVLFALILAVGMLVDGAIVVTEYADRKMAEGMHRRLAYAQAAQRMFWPIASSTLTTLAAFFPLLFWPGIVGQFMGYLPLTLLATLVASLIVSVIFVPVMGAIFGKPSTLDAETMRQLVAAESGDLRDVRGFTGGYVRFLNRVLNRPGMVVFGAFALLVGIWVYYAKHGNGVEFFPEIEPEQAIVLVHARGNLSIHEKHDMMVEVEKRVIDMSEIKSVYTRVGTQRGGSDQSPDTIGSILLELTDWQHRPPARQVLAAIRERTADIAGIHVETREPEAGPPTGKPVQVQLSSLDATALAEATTRVSDHFSQMAGLIDIEDDRPLPGIEWRLDVDRAEAAKFGLDVSLIGQSIRLITNGLKLSEFRPDDSKEEIDIVARYPTEYRTLDQLDAMRVETALGSVPIGSFVERQARPKVSDINRVAGKRTFAVKANFEPAFDAALGRPKTADDYVQDLRAWLQSPDALPKGVDWKFKGEDEEQKAAQAFLGRAFFIALFIMFLILLTQFNSLYNTALILSAVVLSTVGVVLGLIITGQPFGIVMTGVGVISLAGIVVNNNIVLIDTFDQLRKDFPDAREAILRTCAQRLRPVMLTTITTILGLVPMALQINMDFFSRSVTIGAPSTQWWVGLSTAVAFGLTFATLLTLVVTPCSLLVRANVRAWRERRAQRRTAPLPPHTAAEAAE